LIEEELEKLRLLANDADEYWEASLVKIKQKAKLMGHTLIHMTTETSYDTSLSFQNKMIYRSKSFRCKECVKYIPAYLKLTYSEDKLVLTDDTNMLTAKCKI
jgi:hypothetical protein